MINKRMSFNVSDDVYRLIQSIAKEKGFSITEIMRQAIGLLKWHHEVQKSGGKVIVERDGKAYELQIF